MCNLIHSLHFFPLPPPSHPPGNYLSRHTCQLAPARYSWETGRKGEAGRAFLPFALSALDSTSSSGFAFHWVPLPPDRPSLLVPAASGSFCVESALGLWQLHPTLLFFSISLRGVSGFLLLVNRWVTSSSPIWLSNLPKTFVTKSLH